jgi:hypothetical protein
METANGLLQEGQTILSPAELVHVTREKREEIKQACEDRDGSLEFEQQTMIKCLDLHANIMASKPFDSSGINLLDESTVNESPSPVQRSSIKTTVKCLVSGDKRRLQDSNYNLDLTYITQNVIAMSMPADKVKGLYRNSFDDVISFLERKHGGHYKVYPYTLDRNHAWLTSACSTGF